MPFSIVTTSADPHRRLLPVNLLRRTHPCCAEANEHLHVHHVTCTDSSDRTKTKELMWQATAVGAAPAYVEGGMLMHAPPNDGVPDSGPSVSIMATETNAYFTLVIKPTQLLRATVGMVASKVRTGSLPSPPSSTIWKEPRMLPAGVERSVALWYWKQSPGLRVGVQPTTPACTGTNPGRSPRLAGAMQGHAMSRESTCGPTRDYGVLPPLAGQDEPLPPQQLHLLPPVQQQHAGFSSPGRMHAHTDDFRTV